MAKRWYQFAWFRARDWEILVVLFAVAVIVVFVPMCQTGYQRPPEFRSRVNMMALLNVVRSYREDQGRWPAAINSDLLDEYGYGREEQESLLTNPRSGFQSYEYPTLEKLFGSFDDPSKVPILWELRDDGTIDPNGCIGYADGHVEGPRDRSNDPVLPEAVPVE